MSRMIRALCPHCPRIVALLIVLSVYGFSRLPALSEAERSGLASRFHFDRLNLSELPDGPRRNVRPVHPSYSHFDAWISSVGASVALNDLDGDGLPDDVCNVDVRSDKVIVAPAPGTPSQYEPFSLDPEPLPYDPSTMAPTGCLPGDFNEDGLMDILVYYWGRTPILFLKKIDRTAKGDDFARASFVPRELVPDQPRWYTNAATQADIDGDGHVDLIIGNYFPDGARVLDAKASDEEAMHGSMSRAFDGGTNRIFLWSHDIAGPVPDVKFREASGVFSEEIARGWTLAVGAADLNGDLLPEIYFANDFGPDRLLYNCSRPGEPGFILLQGEKTLLTPNSKVLGRDSFKGMGVDFGDLNQDGLLDIYVSNIASDYALEESHFLFLSTGEIDRMKDGHAPYTDRSEDLGLSRSGWSWESRLADFDNDSVLEAMQAAGFLKGEVNRWPELHEVAMGNDQLLSEPGAWHSFRQGDDLDGNLRNPFFVRAPDGRYYDLSEEIGLDGVSVSRGIATADVDGDGRLDFAVANQWGASYLYQNRSPDVGGFLGLHLLLPPRKDAVATTRARSGRPGNDTPGRPAVGAFASVRLPGGQLLVAQVDGGNGHSGKRSQDLHFGLGQLSPDARLEVQLRWRGSEGEIHNQVLMLSPGWHTVILGG